MTKGSKFHLSGIVWMIQSSVAFSVMALCVKIASPRLPILEIIFFRSLIGTVITLAYMIPKGVPLLGKQRTLLTWRGIVGFGALSFFFFAISRLPLSVAVILNFMSPIFAALLAMIFLRERPGFLLISMTLLSFLGVYFLVEGQLFGWNLTVFIGLASALFAGIAYVLVRAVKHRESPLTVIFYFAGISTLGSLFYFPFFDFIWPTLLGWLVLLGVGIGSFFGQLWLTIALRRAPASLVGPFSYVTPLCAFLYGITFFGEKPTPLSLFGGTLIIVGGSLISYFETKRKKKRK